MFRIKGAVIFVIVTVLACGWGQPGTHAVRVKNNYLVAFTNFRVGGAAFHDVQPGEVEAYQPVAEGEQRVVGECPPVGKIEGTLSFDGSGQHCWTVVVGASGFLTLMEDR